MVATRRLARLRIELEARLELPDQPFAVALSGGADSAALAGLSSPARLIHVHHGRPHSDRMQDAAQQIADQLQIPLLVLATDVKPWSENEARNRRYQLLLSNLEQDESLLTGHTADDQAETVLANVLRGTGATGLSGIPRHRGRIVRPMLAVTRSETREFATLAGLPWEDDPSNQDLDQLRNRIRHRLLPVLEAEYNPAVRSALVSLADLVDVSQSEGGGETIDDGWRIENSVLWAAGLDNALRLVRTALRPYHDGYGLDRGEALRVWGVVTGESKATELRSGIKVERAGPWLVFRSLPLRREGK